MFQRRAALLITVAFSQIVLAGVTLPPALAPSSDAAANVLCCIGKYRAGTGGQWGAKLPQRANRSLAGGEATRSAAASGSLTQHYADRRIYSAVLSFEQGQRLGRDPRVTYVSSATGRVFRC